jgi:FMN phosphatase YigB (HAD superfamily)
MIKAVLFDFGGVLTEGGKLGSVRAMFAAVYGIPPENIRLDGSVQAAFRGTISDQEFAETINRLNPDYPPATTAIFFSEAEFFVRCDAVYALAQQLRTHGIRTGIFSNVFKLIADELQEQGFYDKFSPLFLSCAYGMLKPEKQFYERALQELQLDATEVIFIDDKDEFLEPARALGMYTVLAESPAQIVADVTALIKEQNNLEL